MLPAPWAQKLRPPINVELVAGQEVFAQYADGITTQPHPGYPTSPRHDFLYIYAK
jgi:hypothetical protein